MAVQPSDSESARSELLDSIIHTMLLALPVAMALACLWVLLAAQPAQ